MGGGRVKGAGARGYAACVVGALTGLGVLVLLASSMSAGTKAPVPPGTSSVTCNSNLECAVRHSSFAVKSLAGALFEGVQNIRDWWNTWDGKVDELVFGAGEKAKEAFVKVKGVVQDEEFRSGVKETASEALDFMKQLLKTASEISSSFYAETKPKVQEFAKETGNFVREAAKEANNRAQAFIPVVNEKVEQVKSSFEFLKAESLRLIEEAKQGKGKVYESFQEIKGKADQFSQKLPELNQQLKKALEESKKVISESLTKFSEDAPGHFDSLKASVKRLFGISPETTIIEESEPEIS